MTYRRKLLLKRILKIGGIAIAVILVLMLLGFTYLSRYLVYTEDGAHFSFNPTNDSSEEALMQTTSAPESPVLVTGETIERANEDTSGTTTLNTSDIDGLLVDYNTLSGDTDLSTIDFSDYNTLMLEMRSGGSEILSTSTVKDLISRAQDQGIYLIAMISCLDDSEYALAHAEDALQITGGALWVTDSGSYYLNPESQNVQSYIADMIKSLGSMGFSEIVLNNFSFPYSTSIVYSSEESDRDQALINSYNNICNLVGDTYTLGILVADPETGHQLIGTANDLYVYFSTGSQVETYASKHEGYNLVFLTDSHDTRFEAYGKITTTVTFSDEVTAENAENENDNTGDDAEDNTEDDPDNNEADNTNDTAETTDDTEA